MTDETCVAVLRSPLWSGSSCSATWSRLRRRRWRSTDHKRGGIGVTTRQGAKAEQPEREIEHAVKGLRKRIRTTQQ